MKTTELQLTLSQVQPPQLLMHVLALFTAKPSCELI